MTDVRITHAKEFEEFLKSDVCIDCELCEKYNLLYQRQCFENWLAKEK